jgi:hypothetical protein
MQIQSNDPLNVACRLMDIARRLDLPLDCLTVTRLEDESSRIYVRAAYPTSALARLFEARALAFLEQLPESDDGY